VAGRLGRSFPAPRRGLVIPAAAAASGWTLSTAALIQAGDNTASTTLAFTTSGTVPAGGWILVGVGSDAALATSISCGGLTWVIASTASDAPNLIFSSIAYAYAPAGLASGTAGTITYAASPRIKRRSGRRSPRPPGRH
jgi:hypothetical protein